MAPDRATMKEVTGIPANSHNCINFLPFPQRPQYNILPYRLLINQGKIKKSAYLKEGIIIMNELPELFKDANLINKIKNRLPILFQLAEQESSRAGKVGMEVGSLREKIIIALLIYKFGANNIDTDIPITEKEVDVKLFNTPISIKTITGKYLSGIKMIWTVDAESAKEFLANYKPICHIILVQVNWNNIGFFYYIPLESQVRCYQLLGKEAYIKLPKIGTNPRGVEISKDAMIYLTNDKLTQKIDIFWKKSAIEFDAYKRWVELWEEE